MAKNTKLELTWIGKDKRPRLEPRVLVEDKDKSYHAEVRHGPDDIFDNMLIHGDNLLALKVLEQQFAGQVKCIFIDPPYNTGSAFTVYDDGIEHSIWLNLMKCRLELLKNLLTPDGSIYCSIDFNEVHYLKILMDEVFGRDCFQREIIWRMGWLSGYKTMAKNYIRNHDTILYYTKSPTEYLFNKELAYNNYDGYMERFNAATRKEIKQKLEAKFSGTKKELEEFLDYISVVGLPERYPFEDTWNCSIYDKLNSVNVVSFAGEKVSKMLGVEEVKGQKSEALLKRIFDVSTLPGDLVLDSFLGSGTTAAVAQKMGRRWIGIELGDHCYTHCMPRLKKVIDGEDNSGVTSIVNWQGGGGYRFYELAPTLIKEDAFGQKVINKEYNPEMLAEAVCKLEGFTYAPSETEYFIHGYSTERDFIYVTTNTLTPEHLLALNERVGSERSLLVCCKAFSKGGAKLPNLTVKKIPKAVLDKCEYGHDDYSLNVKNLPMAAKTPKQGDLFD